MNQNQKLNYIIREVNENDINHLIGMVKGLAEYEKLSHEVLATEELYRENGFGMIAYFKALLVESLAANERRYLGFALYFFTFSTFTGRPTLYLEDLFVLPEVRGKGIGKALLRELAKIAVEKKCGRMEWAVLDWNQPAIEFYESINAKPLSDWTVYRLNVKDIYRLADS